MNDKSGTNPFASMELTSTSKVDKVASNLTQKVDRSAIKSVAPKKSKITNQSARQISNTIYFSDEVREELLRLKKEGRVNVSGLVDSVMKEYLKL